MDYFWILSFHAYRAFFLIIIRHFYFFSSGSLIHCPEGEGEELFVNSVGPRACFMCLRVVDPSFPYHPPAPGTPCFPGILALSLSFSLFCLVKLLI